MPMEIKDLKINTYGDGIYEIENFISDEESSQFLSLVNLNGDEDWNNSHIGSTTSVLNNYNTNLFRLYGTALEEKIKSCFSNLDSCIPIMNIRRLKVGEFTPNHTDLGPKNNQTEMIFGIVVYLNDDYEGGELYYSDIDFKLKPKKNSLVIHRSTNPHEVFPVQSGTRYSITSFILGNESTEFLFK